ncbi:unnamed protein product [Rhizophagus irregularis]|nr:unnamed protein product [Rhizophagus irregularis]
MSWNQVNVVILYGKFRKDLKLFIMQITHIEIFIVETYYISRSNEQKIEEININSNGNSGKSIKISSSSSKTSLTDRIKIENNNEVNL